ncbi:flagellar hook-length control protein FliK [Pseudomonas flexibilis]|uniref:Flagellar hook-length control protein FliK n=2 Tax=Pseudomonas flexibilis TaxID=706570 RepID=A0A1N6YT86_9PSED|nr:flagellar hook-length control protein FliK [Pseudomonas flexibilis]
MMQALRNSVQLQVQQNQQVATIRLDPPELGSLEIQVSQESGRISIQISAAQADTLRLLQQTSDRLRHELLNQQFVQVSVQVGGEGHSGQQSRQNQGGSGEALVRGNPLQDIGDASSHAAPRDVLATV